VLSLLADRRNDKLYKAFISYSHAVDRQLAPALKSALQRFARPWYALRAMRVFHDTTNLSVSPDLWGAIEAVLKEVEFLLLLASPEAAASKWVRKELVTFAATGRAANIVLVLTAGELHWDDDTGDFDWNTTTALPRLARPLFARQPLFIDMRWARQPTQLDLGDPRFRSDIASISSALLGVELDELVERDIIERRRSLRIARAAVIALAALSLGVLASSALFVVQRDIAQAEANIARARQLAAEANLIVVQDPSRIDTAVRLAAEGLRLHQGVETERALRDALALLPRRLAAGRHDGSVDQIHVLADGNTFLTLSGNGSSLPEDNRIRLWNLPDGAEQRVIDTVDTLMALAVSKNGRYIVGGGFGRVLRVWDAATGRLIAASKPQEAQIGSIALLRSGRVAATAGYDSKVQLWRTDDASPLATLTHGDRVNSVVANGEGDSLLTASDDGTARLWTLDGHERRRFRAEGTVSRATFLGQGHIVVTASAGGAVRLWDVRTGRLLRVLLHDRDVERFEGTADGRLLATAEINGPVRIWDTSTGRELLRLALSGNVDSLAFDASGTRLATGSFRGAHVWDVRTGTEQARVRTSGWANTVAFAGVPLRLLVGSSDGAVGVWVSGRSFDGLSPRQRWTRAGPGGGSGRCADRDRQCGAPNPRWRDGPLERLAPHDTLASARLRSVPRARRQGTCSGVLAGRLEPGCRRRFDRASRRHDDGQRAISRSPREHGSGDLMERRRPDVGLLRLGPEGALVERGDGRADS
jgi:WD40 repeat protein